jgi:hypothetical protein
LDLGYCYRRMAAEKVQSSGAVCFNIYTSSQIGSAAATRFARSVSAKY